jgi:hypothetical protein
MSATEANDDVTHVPRVARVPGVVALTVCGVAGPSPEVRVA